MSIVVDFNPPSAWRRPQDGRKCGFKYKAMVRFLALTRRRLCVLGLHSTMDCTAPQSGSSGDLEGSSNCDCWCGCGRRQVLASILGTSLATSEAGLHAGGLEDGYLQTLRAVHPKRPDWYEEFYAQSIKCGMVAYEAEAAKYKEKLFESLRQRSAATTVLELGVGTGPNLKYYARSGSGMSVIGIDPNEKMEKYARAAAADAGLSNSQFKFIHAVGEQIPLATSTVDSVISTLVLCSVKDLNSTLQEVKRVLKPGATFYFLEHVAAQEGSSVRFWQNVLDPVQQFVADGCHLTRDTLSGIQSASFASVAAQRINISSAFLISPHVIGTAQSSRL
ncbi:methyltransferase-like protein 7A isoform X1 [Selaginella moellendorffii]|uniref:methyltransferase-like protein 7A isoform X1 n=1 Tax=Selaginella moellendorffii TaxID=88036 RepID=UPI000D1D01AF|nr:methyltransferase-like protein 7A isoform X1 [Selaginella moellendorffii]|eukprot:XP_002985991.2 methyltransferase-like protein 7A isoform X1 [Selaginella moellendorffii]